MVFSEFLIHHSAFINAVNFCILLRLLSSSKAVTVFSGDYFSQDCFFTSFFMFCHIVFTLERFSTDITRIRSVICMDFHMFVQIRFVCKRFFTSITYMVVYPIMDFHMYVQIRFVCKTFFTNTTYMVVYPIMNLHMVD